MSLSKVKSTLFWVVFAVLLAGSAAAAVLFAANSRSIYGFALAGGILWLFGAFLCGNLRLFNLWSLILAVPLNININFRVIPHMGGAGGFSLELSDPFLMVMLVLLARDLVRDRIPGIRVHSSILYWGGMILLGVAFVIMGPWRTTVSHEVVRMAKVALLFLALTNELMRREQIRHVALALIAGVLLQSVVALVQYGTNARFGLESLGEAGDFTTKSLEIGTLLGSRVYRVGGLMGHPNVLAPYIAMVMPLGIALLFARISVKQKWFIGVTLLLSEGALIATLSRSGWICFGLGVVLVLLLALANAEMRRRYMMLRLGLLSLFVIVGVVFSGPIVARLTRSDPSAVETRYHLAAIAWKMIRARPVLGFGLNTYVFEMVPYTEAPTPAGVTRKYGSKWPAVHNIYLMEWAEQGLVGLSMFLLAHAALLRSGLRNMRLKDDVMFAISLGCCCGILAVMLDGVASFTLKFSGPQRVFWVLGALIVSIRWLERNRRTSPTSAAIPPQASPAEG